MAEIRKVKDYVEKALMDDERCRNSDLWLTIRVLQDMGFHIYVPYDRLGEMPSLESIRRCRQMFQSLGEFMPTDQKVLDGRERHRKEMKQINVFWEGDKSWA